MGDNGLKIPVCMGKTSGQNSLKYGINKTCPYQEGYATLTSLGEGHYYCEALKLPQVSPSVLSLLHSKHWPSPRDITGLVSPLAGAYPILL